EVDDGVGREGADDLRQGGMVLQLDGEGRDGAAGQRAPELDPLVERADTRQRLEGELVIPEPPHEAVQDADVGPACGEVKRGRPAAVPVASEDQDSHRALTVSAAVALGPTGSPAPVPRPPWLGREREQVRRESGETVHPPPLVRVGDRDREIEYRE